MKKPNTALIVLAALFINNYCLAEAQIKYAYNSQENKILAHQSGSDTFLEFYERNEGNSSYYFDFFGEKPAIVHDNDSLNSYSSYSILDYKDNNFRVDCIYVEAKSNQNGINSKQGLCGLNIKIDRKENLAPEKFDNVANDMVSRNNSIDTSYFITGKVKYLPIIIFRNHDKYIYKVYKSEQDLIDGKGIVFSCKNNFSDCDSYNERTWIVISKTNPNKVEFKEISKSSNGTFLTDVKPITSFNKASLTMPPFEIASGKAYFYDATFNKKRSYLIKGDKVTLLSMDNNKKWCKINYLSEENKNIDATISCFDMSIAEK